MNIKTKYEIGDTVYTINVDTYKVKTFVIDSMTASVSADGSVRINLYEKGDYTAHAESKCFPSERDLLNHITTNEA